MKTHQTMKIISLVSVAGMLMGSAAQAATLNPLSGSVRVNQGSGYQPAAKPGPLKAGDRVMVSPGGRAQVSYSCGLTETVAPGAVYTTGDDAKKCSRQASTGYGPKPMLFHGDGPLGLTPLEMAAAAAAATALTLCLTETGICDDSSSSP